MVQAMPHFPMVANGDVVHVHCVEFHDDPKHQKSTYKCTNCENGVAWFVQIEV